MWIKIKRKIEDFDPKGTTEVAGLITIEDEQFINLDRVEGVIVREKSVIFCFRKSIRKTITPENATNFEKVKMLIEKGIAIEVADVYIQKDTKEVK